MPYTHWIAPGVAVTIAVMGGTRVVVDRIRRRLARMAPERLSYNRSTGTTTVTWHR